MNEVSLRPTLPGISRELAQLVFGNPVFAGVRIRSIEMNDANRRVRQAWLDEFMRARAPLDFAEKPEILLSRAFSDFDVIVLGGDDAMRLSAFMLQHAPLMFGKTKICLCTASVPEHRVWLLNAGFDAVIDTAEMRQPEFLARLYTIWRRYRNNQTGGEKSPDWDAMIDRVADAGKLSPKHRIILRMLLQMPGHEASYGALRAAAGKRHEAIGLQNLKVLISRLRKFLRPGFHIAHEGSTSYRLVGPDGDW